MMVFMSMHKARVVRTPRLSPRFQREVWETKHRVVRSVTLPEALERVVDEAVRVKSCCHGDPRKSEMPGIWNVCQRKVQEADNAILSEEDPGCVFTFTFLPLVQLFVPPCALSMMCCATRSPK